MAKCRKCRKEILASKKDNIFCNHSCSASFNNQGNQRNFKFFPKKKKIKKKCLGCDKDTYNPKYCNSQCQQNYKWKLRKERIEKENKLFTNRDKRYLVESRGNKCEICGISNWQSKKLVMIKDHIDGNSEDDSLKNLRLICPNCDSQTSTYKSKNKGNGRYYRRKRYAEGKSY